MSSYIEDITNHIYEKSSERFDDALINYLSNKNTSSENRTLAKIYEEDPKLLSHIRHNHRTKNNRYLFTDTILDSVTEKLGFSSNIDLLWGSPTEREDLSKYIFKEILWHFLFYDQLYYKNVRNFLIGHPQFAMYIAYWEIFFNNSQLCNLDEDTYFPPAIFYGIREDNLIENIERAYNESLDKYVYHYFNNEIDKCFESFYNNCSSFKKLDQKIKNDLIKKTLIPFINDHNVNHDSIGYRVYHLIIDDLSHVGLLVANMEETNPKKAKIISASSNYINCLMNIFE